MSEPRIGVLIPAYNEELVLKGTIDALVAADCARKDIYVVDDRSTDRTHQIAIECGVNIYTVPENGGKARAQVAALEHFGLLSKYDWMIFLDGDTKVDPYFINAMHEAAVNDPSVALYVGQVKSVENDHVFSALRAVDYAYGQDVAKHGQSNFNVIFVSPGCASMYRCDVLAQLHIDHLTLAEDMDLTMQVHRAGHRAVYLPKAIVNTQDPSTLRDYSKQMLRWFRGFWQVVLKHKVFGFAKKQRVDFYIWLLVLDSILFNRILWIVGLCIALPERWWQFLLIDVGMMAVVACYGAYRTKRTDILKKFHAIYVLGFVSTLLYIRALIEIVILRKEILAWNKVKRYDFSSNQAA